jgi:hypothetical protein
MKAIDVVTEVKHTLFEGPRLGDLLCEAGMWLNTHGPVWDVIVNTQTDDDKNYSISIYEADVGRAI